MLGGGRGGGENVLGGTEAGEAFASNLEHPVGTGATDIGEGHTRHRGLCEQRHGGVEVSAKVRCVLHMRGLIVTCKPWVIGVCLSSPKERVGLLEDAEKQ